MAQVAGGVVQFGVQVSMQHTSVVALQKDKNYKGFDGEAVRTLYDNYLYGIVRSQEIHINQKDIVNQTISTHTVENTRGILDLTPTEFHNIFQTHVDVFQGKSDEVGNLICDCNRGKLFMCCRDIISKRKKDLEYEKFPRAVQKPINDLELYEWIRDFPEMTEFKELTTKSEGFSTGFGLINKNGSNTTPITSEQTKMNLVRRELIDQAAKAGVSTLYYFTPQGVASNTIVEQGITINFIPVPDNILTNMQRRIQDNSHLFNSLNPVIDDGAEGIDIDGEAEAVVANLLSTLKTSLDIGPLNNYFNLFSGKTKYTFSNFRCLIG